VKIIISLKAIQKLVVSWFGPWNQPKKRHCPFLYCITLPRHRPDEDAEVSGSSGLTRKKENHTGELLKIAAQENCPRKMFEWIRCNLYFVKLLGFGVVPELNGAYSLPSFASVKDSLNSALFTSLWGLQRSTRGQEMCRHHYNLCHFLHQWWRLFENEKTISNLAWWCPKSFSSILK
jgi:hypothetical protein